MKDGLIPLDQIRTVLFVVLGEAGEIVMKYFSSDDLSSQAKDDTEIVTKADLAVDTFLRKKLSELYPSFVFLTEEVSPDASLSLRNAENLWVIDPLDGTTNFSRKFPRFALSVALVRKGKPVLGIIYDPLQRVFCWAQENTTGAWKGTKRIFVSKTNQLKESVLLADWPYKLESRKLVVGQLDILSQQVRQIRMQGCAVLDLASVAEGVSDGYFHPGLKPWDVAAVSLLIEKAGGKITKLDGSGWDIFTKGLLVSNWIIHEPLVSALQK